MATYWSYTADNYPAVFRRGLPLLLFVIMTETHWDTGDENR